MRFKFEKEAKFQIIIKRIFENFYLIRKQSLKFRFNDSYRYYLKMRFYFILKHLSY